MGYDAIKLELIEWLTSLEDNETIEYLKLVKEANTAESDWWNELSVEQKNSIRRGLKDIEENRVVSHEDVKKKYGL